MKTFLPNHIYSLLCFLIVISACSSLRQKSDISYQQRLSAELCNCLEQKTDLTPNYDVMIDACQKEINLKRYRRAIIKDNPREKGISRSVQGYFAGVKAGDEINLLLAAQCDAFEKLINIVRDSTLLVTRENFTSSKIETLEWFVKTSPTAVDILWERGTMHFAFGRLDKAEIDFKKCLDLNPSHPNSLYFMGWIHERQEDFPKALEYYEKVYQVSGIQEFQMFIELMKKKILTKEESEN